MTTRQEKEASLDAATVRGLLSYDPATGIFRWLQSKRGRMLWRDAGFRDPRGYVTIRIDGSLFYSHRLAWLYASGEWPKEELDHIDCDPGNNRLANLREATSHQNRGNTRLPSHNRSGTKGAYEDKRRHRWYAQICKGDKQYHLGCFATQNEAHAAYLAAAVAYFGEFARGG